jgi:hypothetical protein
MEYQTISEKESKKIQISVGEAVNVISEKSGADAILLLRFSGFDKSSGYVAKDVGTSLLVTVLTLGTVVPVSAASGAITEVALIDGVTGDVLWADVKYGGLNSDVGDTIMNAIPDDIDSPNAN